MIRKIQSLKLGRENLDTGPSNILIIPLTDDIFEASDPDVRDSSRGRIDSSNISRALSLYPTVKANKPTQQFKISI